MTPEEFELLVSKVQEYEGLHARHEEDSRLLNLLQVNSKRPVSFTCDVVGMTISMKFSNVVNAKLRDALLGILKDQIGSHKAEMEAIRR